jgi:hypothetical protein
MEKVGSIRIVKIQMKDQGLVTNLDMSTSFIYFYLSLQFLLTFLCFLRSFNNQ